MTSPPADDRPPEHGGSDPRAGGRPGLATVIGAALILLLAAQHGDDPPQADDFAGKLGYVVGSASIGLVVWAICYAITIKRASRSWKIASLIVLLVAGLIYGMVSLGRESRAQQADAEALKARLTALAAADPASARLGAGTDAGPMTRLAAAGGALILADSRRLAAAQDAAGLQKIVSLDGLTPSSPILDHCDRLAALAPLSRANDRRFPAYIAAVRKEGDAIVAEGKASRGDVDAFIRGMAGTEAKFVRQNALAADIAANGADFCRILARRNWARGIDGKVTFTASADLAAMQAVEARINPLLAEYNAAREAGVAGLGAITGR